jgi:hypothetical protein
VVDAAKVASFVLNPPFVNPFGGSLRDGENAYKEETQ